MAIGDSATIEVDGHRLALTHLRKVLYPATGTTKSDIITYFAEVAHAMIPHLAQRPVTRKRWPDGVTTAPFFHKDLPRGTPSWVTRRTIQHSDGPKSYPIVDSPATLAWLGQIAALELHVPQWTFHDDVNTETRSRREDAGQEQMTEDMFLVARPNRLVFDLDPGPGVTLADCARVAEAVRARMQDSPLVPVTSGSKGIHLYSWLDGSLTSDEASAFAREIAEAIERDMPDLAVSRMAKVLRRGKVFIDWSQNNGAKTTIAPYSLRGRERPTVAAPRTWEELADPELRHLEYLDVLRLLDEAADPMAGLETGDNDGAEHRGVRGRRARARSSVGRDAGETPDSDGDVEASADGSRLDTYRAKRSASRTPEPVPEPGNLPHGNDDTFVIQEHHARRLHYDFRLERDGVLVSWAVPRGIPTDSGHNRLAVQTEDHPLEYAEFSGTIPRGEYGGGTVTIWDSGTYATEKWRDGEVIVVLDGERARGRYALIRTNENSWLMHRMKDQNPNVAEVANPAADNSRTGPRPRSESRPGAGSPPNDLRPMLATPGSVDDISDETAWRFEGKWDGIRALATFGRAGLRLHSRAGNEFTHAYPELAELAELLDGHGGVLDGEIVALDEKGRTSFSRLQQRMNLVAARDVARVRESVPVQFWLFDVLYLDGVSLLGKRYDDRRRLLEALPLSGGVFQIPDQLTATARDALQESRDRHWEGIVAKKADSAYLPGKRSRSWIKIKNFQDLEVVIVGWRPGAGRREGSIGSLLLAVPDAGGTLHYAGKVGTGFSDVVLDQLMATLTPLRTERSAVAGSVPRADSIDAVWVRPELVGEVTYAQWTPDRRLRATSWRGLRPDKSVSELVPGEQA